jgi:hypothetical protein
METHFGIEIMARERQRQFLEEAARDRMAREITRETKRAYRERRDKPRTSLGLGPLYSRVRTWLGGKPRPTLTREPVG